ncbi:hypothetical protein PHMEG_0001031 [Phytophthora megakarya]|uniref:Uncharacterized protein n=1 Tax=Phytophthora megakarya TaxID=4795 RepID=A0A225X2U0_9STRA|nr:hypothetical protein PHMEG_0001031 [Phytophthora megakarya]
MSSVTWRSSWVTTKDVSVQFQSDSASLSSLQFHRPESDAPVPCQVSLHWSPPLRCHQLQLEVECSARHVELHAEGTRRTLLGEEEQGEVYLGTFRGSKSSEPQMFTMSPAFKQNDRNCDILKSLQTLTVKFVSLTEDKSVLKLPKLRCEFAPMEPVATVDTSAVDLAAKLAGLGLGGAPDVQMILKGFQQTLEREMETKIAQVIDAKLSTLSQRLAFSEQALYQLHKKMDAKDAHVQANLAQVQHKFSQLEEQLNQFNVMKAEEQVTDAVEAKVEQSPDTDDRKGNEMTEVAEEDE